MTMNNFPKPVTVRLLLGYEDAEYEYDYKNDLWVGSTYADEIRRECAERAVEWQFKLCVDDNWPCERCTECNQLRNAIMIGKE